MNKSFQHINLSKYLPFFASCSNSYCALAFYSGLGVQQGFECSTSTKHFNKILQTISHHFEWDSFEKNSSHLLDCQGYIQLVSLTIDDKDQCYWLVGIQLTDQIVSTRLLTQQISTLRQIAYCINDDVLKAESLRVISDELATCSEELNLLYGIDDSDSCYQNKDEQESLSQLSGTCIDFLDIDLAVIHLPELEICVHKVRRLDTTEIDELITVVNNEFYPIILKCQETRIINDNKDGCRVIANLKKSYKFIIVPIVKSTQQINGILVLIKSANTVDFSQSDRKLAEILAAEAAKLTQARRDIITGQLNRRGITEKLDKLIVSKTTESNGLLLINLDQFKVINDTAGQAGGDQLLKQVNLLIRKYLKKSDALGRLGADEFAVILPACNLQDAYYRRH